MLFNRFGLASICHRSNRRCNHTLRELLRIQPEVVKALQSCEPVASLESTIVAHGMPYPQNLEVALEVEDILRSKVRYIRINIHFFVDYLFCRRIIELFQTLNN